jgi:hypothetical protein
MESIIKINKKSAIERFSKLFGTIIGGSLIIFLFKLIQTNTSSSKENVFMYSIIIFFCALYIVFLTSKWYKTYIYEISTTENELLIKYSYYNKDKSVALRKEDLEVILKDTPVRNGKLNLLIIQQGKERITQYAINDWNQPLMKEVHDKLISWKSGKIDL